MTRFVYILDMSNDPVENHVRRYRRVADITQAQLAEQVEVSRQTIVSIEGGDYSPSVYLALRIAAVLSTSVEDLFGDGETSSIGFVSSTTSND